MKTTFLLRAGSASPSEQKRLLDQLRSKSELINSGQSGLSGGTSLAWEKGDAVLAQKLLKDLSGLGWSKTHSEKSDNFGWRMYTVSRPNGDWPLMVAFSDRIHLVKLITFDVDKVEDLPSEPGESKVDQEMTKLANSLLPKNRRGPFEWSVYGGRAGVNVLRSITMKLKNLGFKPLSSSSHGSPDGSTMGGGEVWSKGSIYVKMVESYGQTKASNSFSCSITRNHDRGN